MRAFLSASKRARPEAMRAARDRGVSGVLDDDDGMEGWKVGGVGRRVALTRLSLAWETLRYETGASDGRVIGHSVAKTCTPAACVADARARPR